MLLAYFASLPLLTRVGSWYSFWYNVGLFGLFPTQNLNSFEIDSPVVDLFQWDPRCDYGYVFLGPRGRSVTNPGPVILDARGNVVWIGTQFDQATDVKVQRYRGQDYLTFWSGRDDSIHGYGSYYMVRGILLIHSTRRPVGLTCFNNLAEFLL